MDNKSLALDIIKLLSALESWGFSESKRIPDYLHENLTNILDELTKEVLK